MFGYIKAFFAIEKILPKGGVTMKNWKTTVSGLLGALPTILTAIGVAIPEPVSKLLLAFGVVFATYFAKDSNVTGGSVPQ